MTGAAPARGMFLFLAAFLLAEAALGAAAPLYSNQRPTQARPTQVKELVTRNEVSRRSPGLPLRPFTSGFPDSSLGTDALWSDQFWEPGADEGINAIAVYQGELVAAGEFTEMDGVPVPGVAAWNGTRWRSLGTAPAFDGGPQCLLVWHGLLVAGGWASWSEAETTYVAAWDGARWTTLGRGGPDSYWAAGVTSLVKHDGALIAAGTFTRVGAAPAPGVARWDGSSWSPLGSDSLLLGSRAIVRAVASFRDTLFAVREKTYAPTDTFPILVRWDGIGWSYVEGSPREGIEALAPFQDRLYAAGYFDSVAAEPAHNIACWDGHTWSALGRGLASVSPQGSFVGALVPSGDRLLVASGYYAAAGHGYPSTTVASWDGHSWSRIGGYISPQGIVVTAGDYLGRTYIGGYFELGQEDGRWHTCRHIAALDGQHWDPVQPREVYLTGAPSVLVPRDDGILAAAPFVDSDEDPRWRIGLWNGSRWSLVGPPLNRPVACLTTWNDHLVAAAYFDTLGPNWGWRVVELDGDRWRPLGDKVHGWIRRLTVYHDSLIVAGVFWNIGDQQVRGIGRWDGQQWTPLGGGLNGYVNDLCEHQGELFAAGDFHSAGNEACQGVAHWDGGKWTAVESDFVSDEWVQIFSLAEWDGRLAARGNFSRVSGNDAKGLASWDGAEWLPVRPLLNGQLDGDFGISMTSYDGRLVLAGGWLSSRNGISNHILQHDGVRWLGMGSEFSAALGVGTSVSAIGSWNGVLYAGGEFERAGGHSSYLFASWDGRTLPRPELTVDCLVAPNPSHGEMTIQWSQTRPGEVRIGIYDVLGRKLPPDLGRRFGVGSHSWSPGWANLGGGLSPSRPAAGVYFVRITSPQGSTTKKIAVIR